MLTFAHSCHTLNSLQTLCLECLITHAFEAAVKVTIAGQVNLGADLKGLDTLYGQLADGTVRQWQTSVVGTCIPVQSAYPYASLLQFIVT